MKTLVEASLTGKRFRYFKCKVWRKDVCGAIGHMQRTFKLSNEETLKNIHKEVWEVEQ